MSDDVTLKRVGAGAVGVVKWLVLLVCAATAVLLVGVSVVAMLAGRVPDGAWRRYADVGEAFGAINSVFSGLALAALVITFSVQFQELRTQRRELAMQREELSKSQVSLHRTAEANMRMLHIELMKMSIDDPGLAAVWPPLRPGLPHEINRQYLYANLIFQSARLYAISGSFSPARIEAHLRYLFTSPLMREYWQAAAYARSFIKEGTLEAELASLADGICAEYETVTAHAKGAAERNASAARHWEDLDADSQTRAA